MRKNIVAGNWKMNLNRNEGIKSYLLASLITSNSKFLTTTLVEIDKGGIQRTHTHYPE